VNDFIVSVCEALAGVEAVKALCVAYDPSVLSLKASKLVKELLKRNQ
jgi:hypothetical protein